jgi:hypothetical protein
MIDLDHAADDLIAAVSGHEPDLARVRERVRHRRRARRLAAATGVVTLLAAAGALAASLTATADGADQVRTGPGPDGPTATSPPGPRERQLVEVGSLRLAVPAGWTVERAADTGGCGGPDVVVIGPVAGYIGCATYTSLRIIKVPLADAPEGAPTTNQIPYVGPLVGEGDSVSTVHLPTLGASLEFGPGVDPGPILASIESTDADQDPGPDGPDATTPVDPARALVLPCGIEVMADREALVLPPGLDVAPQAGMGGWAPGTGEELCALHFTDPSNSGRHVTFASGRQVFAIGQELGGRGFAELGLRFGTIEAGYGAEVHRPATDPATTFHALAYGITEDEAVALFASLAPR